MPRSMPIRRSCLKTGRMSPLGVLLVLKALQAYGYYGLCIILALFLSSELGFSDSAAGGAYGALGMGISVASVATGSLVDRLGVRRATLFGAVILTVSRAVLATTTVCT